MRDLWLAISQVSKLLDNKLPSLDPQKKDHLELEVQLNALKGQLNLSKEVISSFMNADRDKHGELQWDYAAWIEVSAPQESSQQRARSASNQRSGSNQRTGSNPWPTYELVIAPLDIGKLVAPKLQLLREKGTTIVFTSATITVNQQFTKISCPHLLTMSKTPVCSPRLNSLRSKTPSASVSVSSWSKMRSSALMAECSF